MKKICERCFDNYSTKDSRQKCCSRECASKLKKSDAVLVALQTAPPLPQGFTEGSGSALPDLRTRLPSPEELPATYVKQVADLWLQLTGTNDTTRKRIA